MLKKANFPELSSDEEEKRLEQLQHAMLRIQQGVFQQGRRAIVVFEGFDASGKGGAIRRLVEGLDPRGVKVHPIAAPGEEEQAKHYLYRFWSALPAPGTIAIFDRSWYGRVLVERVEKLAPKHRLKQAYREINDFERKLTDDGIDLVKIFLAISADEQLERFRARLEDPYKQWKISEDDLRARAKWKDYVRAADELLARTDERYARWHLIPADDKPYARVEALGLVTRKLAHHGEWMEKRAKSLRRGDLARELARLKKI